MNDEKPAYTTLADDLSAIKVLTISQLEEMFGPRGSWDPLGIAAAAAAWLEAPVQPVLIYKVEQ